MDVLDDVGDQVVLLATRITCPTEITGPADKPSQSAGLGEGVQRRLWLRRRFLHSANEDR